MKHCYLSLSCNELPFIKQKLPFLYKYFSQIIFIDYDILNKCNSTDGTIEYIESLNDPDNKIILLTDFDPDKIKEYNGVSIIEKQKMFAYGSKYIKDDIDIIWATDLDEFFKKELINKIENMYLADDLIVSIDIPHINFVYNQYNRFHYDRLFYIKPRITKHVKGKIYGHCNFETYGKTIKITDYFLYHFSYIGYNRCYNKLILFNTKTTSKHEEDNWCKKYKNVLEKGDKYININHPGSKTVKSKKYEGKYPDYIDIESMINELNQL